MLPIYGHNDLSHQPRSFNSKTLPNNTFAIPSKMLIQIHKHQLHHLRMLGRWRWKSNLSKENWIHRVACEEETTIPSSTFGTKSLFWGSDVFWIIVVRMSSSSVKLSHRSTSCIDPPPHPNLKTWTLLLKVWYYISTWYILSSRSHHCKQEKYVYPF